MFTYKGKSSKDMYLRVLNEVVFTSPTRDVNVIQIPGRDGDIIMNNGRYESVIRTVPCRLETPEDINVEQVINDINNWLIDEENDHELSWENDPDFKYLARIDNGVISQRFLSRFGHATINFRLQPIKYLRDSLIEQAVPTGTNLVNPFNIDANPVIRIIGSGDITIIFDEKPLVLTDINEGCVIDSEKHMITSLDGRVMLFKSMRSPFPVLKPRNNQITFSRSDIQVFITPRWGTLV